MSVTYEDPVTVKADSPVYESKTTHPAYAQIGAYRVSGNACLYGSDFVHHGYMTIRISRSEHCRGVAQDWYHSGPSYIEVNLSEAQWATFISTPNMGEGVPCTVRSLEREAVPQIPEVRDVSAMFHGEVDERLKRAVEGVKELAQYIKASSLTNKAKEEVRHKLDSIYNDLGPNLKFVSDSFGGQMEKYIEKAKIEVSGYITGMVQRAGIKALKAPIDIEMKKLPAPEVDATFEDKT